MNSPSLCKVVVIDDHPIVSTAIQGIAMTIPNLEFAGLAKDCASGKALVAKVLPALAITDVSLPDGDGIDLIHAIRGISPETRILAFSMNKEETLGPRVLKAGAHGYLMKGAPIPQIQEAIQTVLRGETYLSPELARTMAFRLIDRDDKAQDVDTLTNREFQVFRLIGNGKTTREVSEFLKISIKTVESHRENIKNKLTCESGTELALRARDWVVVNSDVTDRVF
jgi:DNA-binding NarL/FixJ family response regulator